MQHPSLERIEDRNVGAGSCSPVMYPVGPYRLEDVIDVYELNAMGASEQTDLESFSMIMWFI